MRKVQFFDHGFLGTNLQVEFLIMEKLTYLGKYVSYVKINVRIGFSS